MLSLKVAMAAREGGDVERRPVAERLDGRRDEFAGVSATSEEGAPTTWQPESIDTLIRRPAIPQS